MDNCCVELKFTDGSMIAIDTNAVENEVADDMYQRSELGYLIIILFRLSLEKPNHSRPPTEKLVTNFQPSIFLHALILSSKVININNHHLSDKFKVFS